MNNPSGEDVGSATLAGYQWHALFGWKLLLRLWQDAEADLVDEAATEYGVFFWLCSKLVAPHWAPMSQFTQSESILCCCCLPHRILVVSKATRIVNLNQLGIDLFQR